MDCKIIDRANKRLAKQHEEIERLCAELDDAKWKYHQEIEDGCVPDWIAAESPELRSKLNTQTENDLATLCQAQSEELVKCRREHRSVSDCLKASNDTTNRIIGERDEAHDAIRGLLGAIVPYQAHTDHAPHMLALALSKTKLRAAAVLEAYTTEDG